MPKISLAKQKYLSLHGTWRNSNFDFGSLVGSYGVLGFQIPIAKPQSTRRKPRFSSVLRIQMIKYIFKMSDKNYRYNYH